MEPMQILKFLADVAELASQRFGEAEPPPMEPMQILKFLADVAELASRRFGEAEPPPSGSADEREARPGPGVSADREPGRSPRPSSTVASAIAALQTPQAMKAALNELVVALSAQVEARRQAERDLGIAAEAFAAERATCERLRAELAELQRALAVAEGQGHKAPAPSRGREPAPSRGRDIEAELEIDFVQMVLGATVPLGVAVNGESRTLDVTVPRGIVDGASLTLAGHGGAGDPPGDVHVRVRVRPDPTLRRNGNDIAMRVQVTPDVLTHKNLTVQTAEGAVKVPLSPERLGETFRFEGKGIDAENQEAGDLLITLDAGPLLDASLDQFPSAAVAFASLRSLSPPARGHLTTLANSALDSTARKEIGEVLWALAVAHERGERGPLRGFAAQLIADLMTRGLLRGSSDARRRTRVFAWLSGRSSLVTRERSLESPCLIWTVHLERLADADCWTHIKAQGLVTH